MRDSFEIRNPKSEILLFAAAVLLASCRSSKPPFSPREALDSFQLQSGFRIELVAAEPEVVNPVAFAFDESGRLFVVEMSDYPLDPKPGGRVRLLEDRDGDGRYEHSSVFTDGLKMPTGVMRWKKGILAICAPDILYFEDTDGDGRADVRRVVLTGFAATNPQLRVNGLQYGIDNWIYAAYPRVPTPRRYAKEFGDRGSPIRFPDRPDAPALDLRSRDLRFQPDTGRLEAAAGNSQFANTFNSWGERFTVWNNDHIRHVVLDDEVARRNPFLSVPGAMQSASDHENAATVYAVTKNPFHIHDSQTGHFTSACGLSVYTGGAFPPEFDNNSFTCEPVHNLIHRDVLVPSGATYKARRAYEGREFLASTDAWFRPVFTGGGPDGALYLADYYHYTVEHPEYVPPEMLKEIDFTPKHQLGRIWRVVHRDAPRGRRPQLGAASTAELVSHLADANMWWRITAQRLIVDRQDSAAIPPLAALAREAKSPLARAHALWTLEGLGSLEAGLALGALSDADPGVRRQAVRLAKKRLNDVRFRKRLIELAADADTKVQFEVAEALGAIPEGKPALRRIALDHIEDPWFQLAVLSSARVDAVEWFRAILGEPAFRQQESKGKREFLQRIASIAGARGDDREMAAILALPPPGWRRTAAFEGLADGLPRGSRRGSASPATQAALLSQLSGHCDDEALCAAALRAAVSLSPVETPALRQLLANGARGANDANATVERRAQAVGVLGLDPSGKSVEILGKLLAAKEPTPVAAAAARSLAGRRGPEVAAVFIQNWKGSTAAVHEIGLGAFFRDKVRLKLLLDAIEAGTVPAWSLGQARVRQLEYHSDPEIRERAKTLLAKELGGDRRKVYERYLPALRAKGDPERGRKVYRDACSECHKLGGEGFAVGPDLLTVTARYKESLLANILMPNEAIEVGYEEYLVETKDGRTVTGILSKDTPQSITLRRAKGEEDTIPRADIAAIRSLNVSSMPEDLEKGISVEQMADLIAFIKGLK